MTVLCSHGFQVYGRGTEAIHVGTGDICQTSDTHVDVAQHLIDTLRESTQQVPVQKAERLDDATVIAENMAAAMREGYDPAAGVPGAYIPTEVLTKGLPSMSFQYQQPSTAEEWCGTNDVHGPHICHGVQRDGTGLHLEDGIAVPLPVEPQSFNPDVQGILGAPDDVPPAYYETPGAYEIQPWAQQYAPVFSINDESGRELLSFRVVEGMVEGKFYFSDLDEASRRFVDYVHSLTQQVPDVPLTD
jgi:hypothetical protein